ncbi:MAG TPA: hypothetical protein VFT43_14665 [Candidatus Polarisedimenticolia bacterium]|nr:hypothetical protein [Candidatus Polarisedimenticolia bacterium]
MKTSKTDYLAILRALVEHHVDFIIVGGVCAVLHGAPIATFDLDVVHSRAPANVDRLLAALAWLDAHFRGQGGRPLTPDRSHLSSPGHQLLMTRFGPLDVLGVIGRGRGYDELLAQTVSLDLQGGLKVRLLDLQALIQTKEEAARDKDKAVLAILRRTLGERTKV